MFKATVVASKLREELAHYLDMVKGKQAVQILHRGSPVRVLITQDHYVDLLSRLSLYENSNDNKVSSSLSIKELEERLLKKLKAAEKDVSSNGASRMGRKRAK